MTGPWSVPRLAPSFTLGSGEAGGRQPPRWLKTRVRLGRLLVNRLATQGGQVIELLIMLGATSVVRRKKSLRPQWKNPRTMRPGDRDLACLLC